MALIGVSGKIHSGKDTIGQIIQWLTFCKYYNSNVSYEDFIFSAGYVPIFEIKKFADTLKDIVCLLINCTREQLEDADFKNTELGEEWNKYYIANKKFPNIPLNGYFNTSLEAVENMQQNVHFTEHGVARLNLEVNKRVLTPRLLLQLLGTECGRDIIHPNIWINALFSQYKCSELIKAKLRRTGVKPNFEQVEKSYPNWVITDMRFPNELEAVKSRGGITIRINRPNPKGILNDFINSEQNLHHSETALDGAEFKYIISNRGTIEDLIESVRVILIKESII